MKLTAKNIAAVDHYFKPALINPGFFKRILKNDKSLSKDLRNPYNYFEHQQMYLLMHQLGESLKNKLFPNLTPGMPFDKAADQLADMWQFCWDAMGTAFFTLTYVKVRMFNSERSCAGIHTFMFNSNWLMCIRDRQWRKEHFVNYDHTVQIKVVMGLRDDARDQSRYDYAFADFGIFNDPLSRDNKTIKMKRIDNYDLYPIANAWKPYVAVLWPPEGEREIYTERPSSDFSYDHNYRYSVSKSNFLEDLSKFCRFLYKLP